MNFFTEKETAKYLQYL